MSTEMPDQHSYGRLHQQIVDSYSREELRSLCLSLNVRYDDLAGDTLSAEAQSLLEWMQRHGRLPDLLAQLQAERPHLDWNRYLPAEPEAKSPYKGLQYFTEADTHLFFGRERLTALLVERLGKERFLVVVGASGSGKSSLVRAGLVPAVRQGEIEINGRSSKDWPVHIITPGDQPLKTLAVSLTRDVESMTAAATLAADLREDSNSLDLFLMRQTAEQPDGRLLLVVDQFEELFTQCNDKKARQQFVGNLVNAVQSGKEGRLKLVLTLRADFYAFAVQYESLRPLLETGQQIVGEMSQAEMREAIEQPAETEGWQFQGGLVETILQDVEGEPGSLPLLSHALQETWNRREGRELTLAGYQAAGGVRGAIAKTADAVYAGLSAEQQALTRTIFLRLTELGEGTEDTRRRVWQAELVRRSEEQETVAALLQRLADARLITTDTLREQDGEVRKVVEVSHEALIREWPALRAWLDDSREWLRFHRNLSQDTKEWLAAERDVSLLYRGGKLAQVQEQTAEHLDELNEEERAFIEAGVQEEERIAAEREAQRQRELAAAEELAAAKQSELEAQQRRTTVVRWAVAGLSLLLVIALAATVLAVSAGQRANERANVAQSQALAVSSLAAREQDPMEALLLAIAAGKRAKTGLAMDALNQQLPGMARPIFLMNHGDSVLGATWNKDESRILTWGGALAARVWDADSETLLLTLSHVSWVNGATWNGDESRILTWSDDGAARVWDAASGDPLLNMTHGDAVEGAAWNEDESRILTWSSDDTARLWDTATKGDPLLTLSHEDSVRGAVWNEDESRILTWSNDGTARLWDVVSGNPLLTLSHDNSIRGAVWNRDESRILTWGADETARILDAVSGDPLLTLSHQDIVLDAAWNKDESRILTWSGDGTARLWDAVSGDPLLTLSHEDWVNGAVWNEDESRILTWSMDGTAWVWDAVSDIPLLTLSHEAWILGASWNRDESRILTWSVITVQVWDAVSGNPLLTLNHENSVRGASWNRDESRILTWSGDSAQVWDAATGDSLLTLLHGGAVYGAVWNENESQILTWSGDDTAQVWDAATGNSLLALRHELEGFSTAVSSATWNGDESRILTGSTDGTVQIWDALSGVLLWSEDQYNGIIGAAWNEDESRILIWGADETARILDADTGEILMILPHKFPVLGATWNEDEGQILTWSADGTARVWDAASGDPLLTLSHEDWVNGAVWNRDESQILTWSNDGTARVWDAETGELLITLFGDGNKVTIARWNNRESRILLGTSGGFMRVFYTSTAELAQLACQYTTRNFTWEEWQRYLPGEPYRQTCPDLPRHLSVPSE